MANQTMPSGAPELRFDGSMIFLVNSEITTEEAEGFLAAKGLEEWFVAGEDAGDVYVARELGVFAEILAEDLSRFGDDWFMSKGPGREDDQLAEVCERCGSEIPAEGEPAMAYGAVWCSACADDPEAYDSPADYERERN